MARVNAEERLYSGILLRRFAKFIGWDEQTSLGTLMFLWHDSQLESRSHGSTDDIWKWSRLEFSDKGHDKKKLVKALLHSDFLRQDGEDYFYIRGNAEQVKSIEDANQKYKKGKKNPAAKNQEPPTNYEGNPAKLPHVDKPLTNQENQGVAESSHQNRTEQNNSEQNRTNQSSTEHTIPSENPAKKNLSLASAQAPSLKSKVPKFWAVRITPEDQSLAEHWHVWSKERTPKGKYDVEKFSEAICKIRVNHNYTIDHVNQIFDFIRNDDFWRNNAISPTSLLKPSKSEPEITKLEQVVRKLRAKPKSKMERLEEELQKDMGEEFYDFDPFSSGMEQMKNVTRPQQ